MSIKDFFRFVIRPTPDSAAPLNPLAAGWATLRLWAVVYMLNLLAAVGINLALAVFGQSASDNAVTQLATEGGAWLTVWLGVLAVPFWEELAFRLGLRPNRLAQSVALAALALFLFQLPLGFFSDSLPGWLFSLTEPLGVATLVAALAVSAAGFWLILGRVERPVPELYARRFGFITYGTLLVFALLHSFNYTRLNEIWFLIPLLVSPQLILALGLSYVRVRLGFVWAVLMHGAHNAFSLLPIVLLAQLSPEVTQQLATGDFAALAQLTGEAALVFAVGSTVWYAMLLGLFISGVSLVWDWVRARPGRRNYAWVSTLLNCLLPGLGQHYNEQAAKGRWVTGLFIVFTLAVGVAFSVPMIYGSPEVLGALGLGAAFGYLALYGYATVDSWLVGARLDRATR